VVCWCVLAQLKRTRRRQGVTCRRQRYGNSATVVGLNYFAVRLQTNDTRRCRNGPASLRRGTCLRGAIQTKTWNLMTAVDERRELTGARGRLFAMMRCKQIALDAAAAARMETRGVIVGHQWLFGPSRGHTTTSDDADDLVTNHLSFTHMHRRQRYLETVALSAVSPCRKLATLRDVMDNNRCHCRRISLN